MEFIASLASNAVSQKMTIKLFYCVMQGIWTRTVSHDQLYLFIYSLFFFIF